MPVDLTKIGHKPTTRWFHYKSAGISLERTDDEAESCFSMRLEYMSQADYRRFLAAAMSDSSSRKAVKREGVKALLADQEATRRALARRVLKDWKLTVRGAVMLEAEADFSGQDPDDTIPFENSQIEFMISHSTLLDQIDMIVQNYDEWFDMNQTEEDLRKNSSTGPDTSTDESPVDGA